MQDVKLSLKDYGLAGVSGLLLMLSFPKWELDGLVWIALVPLFFATQYKSAKQTFLLGSISGLIFFYGSLNWIVTTIVTYGHIAWLTGFLAFFLMAVILAAYVGLYCVLLRKSTEVFPQLRILAPPLIWTAIEFLRGHFFIPFPWDFLGYTQYRHLWIIQIADISSVYGVSFFIVLVNSLLFDLLFLFTSHGKTEKPQIRYSRRPLILTFFLFLTLLAYGKIRLVPPENGQSVRVSVIQGNIDQDKKWDDQYREETIRLYESLTREALPAKPDLILWPETSTPFLFEKDPVYRERMVQFVSAYRVPLLFGSPALDRFPTGSA